MSHRELLAFVFWGSHVCEWWFLSLVFVVGTLGYVMSEVEDGKPLSQVVKAAKNLGYTEPGSYNSFAFL